MHRLVPAAFPMVFIATGPAVARDSLTVAANSPTVTIAPRNPGRSFLRLPALEYEFEIYANCADNRSPESLSLNVADTRRSLVAGQIIGDGPTEFSLNVPASQIAPIVVEDFCVLQDGQNDEDVVDLSTHVTIPAALSAQASLLCKADEDRVMTYVSRTLDVSLVCDRSTQDVELGEDQGQQATNR